MNILKKVIFLSILGVSFYCCQKINYYENEPLIFERTLSIAHRGGGNVSLRENSFESCINALLYTDGLEVDVQLSKDRTVWLSHAAKVESCGETLRCFAETTDIEIEAISTCLGQDISYTKLEDVLRYMHLNNIHQYISIDLKGWQPCDGSSLNIEAIMRVAVEEVIKLGEQYDLIPFLLFETQIPSVLKWAKKENNSVGAYITSFGDFEKGMLLALKHELDGISYKGNFGDELDAGKVNLLHKKGLKIMVWNIPDSTYMKSLESINVDFLQVDL